MRRITWSWVAATAAFAVACGGSGGGSPGPSPSPGTSTNPCVAVAIESLGAQTSGEPVDRGRRSRRGEPDPRWSVLDLLYGHRIATARALIRPLAAPVIAEDVGEIAVMRDEGDLIARANFYDLRDIGLVFTRNGQGGYDVARSDAAFRSPLGTRLTLADDDSVPAAVPFAFPLYGQPRTSAFINSDGNITFDEEDRASTARDVSRFLTGPPRVAPFFTDLDPSAGGAVFLNAVPGAFTVTWCGVRAFESTRTTTVQATMLPDGSVEMKFGASINIGDAVVGVSPGRTGSFAAVDLSSASGSGGAEAIGERFSARVELDTVSLVRKFYEAHPDAYDQLVIWTDVSLIRSGFAHEVTIANEIRGIGLNLFDTSRDFGSSGRLRSIAMMDALPKYPDDPALKFLGENTTLSVLAQEVGHRWLAFFRFRDHNRTESEALLGRDEAHWSFFLDSDASVMEGNDIEDLGGGSFRTVDAVSRYSLLDQYAMGLVAEHEVPTFFYVADPVNVTPFKRAESDPQIGVTFSGTRRDVLIQDVIDVMGPRQPSARDSARVLRQAFIYVVSADRAVDSGQVDKLDRIRREWEQFFARATNERMRAETRLRVGT